MYSLALATFYLGASLWLVDGLPFSRAPKAGRATAAFGVTTAFVVLIGIVAAVQYFVIFPRMGVVLVTTLVLAGAAWAGAAVSFTIVERSVRGTLDLLTAGPNRMFQATQEQDS